VPLEEEEKEEEEEEEEEVEEEEEEEECGPSVLFDLGVVCCIIIRRSDALIANTEKAKGRVSVSRVIAC